MLRTRVGGVGGAVEVAGALARRYDDVALLHSGRGSVSYVAAGADAVSNALDPYEGAPHGEDVPYWIGAIPYEARRVRERPDWVVEDRRPAPFFAAPEWRRFPAVVRLTGGDAEIIGEEVAVERLVEALQTRADPPTVSHEVVDVPDAADHLRRVRRARELILNGDLYQVNLARRFGVSITTDGPFAASMVALYAQLSGPEPSRFGAMLLLPSGAVVSMSPELCLRAEATGGRLTTLRTEPIKGTRPRGATAAEDDALMRELEADPKERSELAMIVDVERHDVGTVCRLGSVRLEQQPRVVTHPTVHHREAAICGVLRPGVSRTEVLQAMVPSGSVTGAPKVRAMEVIGELEDRRRGIYTGAIGYIARSGAMTLSMAIRTLVVRGQRGVYWSGGGIVAASDPERECAETEWKARRLLR